MAMTDLENDCSVNPCDLCKARDAHQAELSKLNDSQLWEAAMHAAETVSFDLDQAAHDSDRMIDLAASVRQAIKDADSAVKALNALLSYTVDEAIKAGDLTL